MIVAMLSNNPPRFPILRSIHPILPPTDMLGTSMQRIYDSPLCSSGTLHHALAGSEFCEESIQTLQRMRNLTIFITRGLNINVDVMNYVPQSPEHDGINARSLHAEPATPSLHRIIQTTASIYTQALSSPPIPFASSVNREAAEEICRAIESPANDATWDQYPGILIWVLLTGVAAARDLPGHSLLVSFLVRVGLGAGYGWWEELSEGMVTFMKVKRRTEVR